MKILKHSVIFLLAVALLGSCATGANKRAPVNGWHKKDHWWAPSNWHLRKGSAPAPF